MRIEPALRSSATSNTSMQCLYELCSASERRRPRMLRSESTKFGAGCS